MAEEQAGIITRDYKGDETVHYGLETLEADTTDGGTKKFVVEDLVPVVEPLAVDLDFSGGDMVINPDVGKAFGELVIRKPDRLIAGNIKEGEDVAGIIGALVAGGKKMKIAFGSTSATGGPVTVEHGLGVVPDFIYFGTKANTQGIRSFLCAYGFSSALIELTENNLRGRYVCGENTNFIQGINQAVESTASSNGIFNATATTFQVAGNSNYPVSTLLGANQWVAIGGLT